MPINKVIFTEKPSRDGRKKRLRVGNQTLIPYSREKNPQIKTRLKRVVLLPVNRQWIETNPVTNWKTAIEAAREKENRAGGLTRPGAAVAGAAEDDNAIKKMKL